MSEDIPDIPDNVKKNFLNINNYFLKSKTSNS